MAIAWVLKMLFIVENIVFNLSLKHYILDKQSFPKAWATGAIIPIYKKGDKTDHNNYRGITLIRCFAKLFTAIINDRLK